MAKIPATFWDCGGVLLTNGWDEHARERVAKHFGLNFDEFEKRHQLANDLWERGKIDVHEYLRRDGVLCSAQLFPKTSFSRKCATSARCCIRRMIEFLRAFARAADSTGGLETYHVEQRIAGTDGVSHPDVFGLTGLFDAYVVSAYIALRKPAVAFFRCALESVSMAAG